MTAVNPFLKAVKSQLKARLALAGPTGSGKTWSALEWASVLGKRIALIDTERGSAALYADHFEFDTLDMPPPYDPIRCVEALRAAEANGYDVVVLDSMSHFWQGEGGTLDIVDAAAQRMGGNKYAGWSVGTPALRHLVDTMLAVDVHLIVTMRSKMDYVEVEKNGRKTYERVGMAPVMRDGIEYEFTLLGDIDLEHRIVISKSRCDLLADRVVQPGRARDAAETFRSWLEQGEPVAARTDVEALTGRMNALGEESRKACKDAFLAEFGRPEHLLASRVAGAGALVATWETKDSPPDGESPRDGDEPPRAADGKSDGEEQAPSAAPADSIEPGTAGPRGGSAPPGNRVLTRRDITVAATNAFPCDDAPHGQKTKLRDRLRYAVAYAATNGERWHLNDLNTDDMVHVDARLHDIAAGRITFEVDDIGVVFTIGSSQARVDWAQFEFSPREGDRQEPASPNPADDGDPASPPAPDGAVDPGTWTEQEWRSQLSARKVKVADALRRANDLAVELNLEGPATIEDLAANPDVARALAEWMSA